MSRRRTLLAALSVSAATGLLAATGATAAGPATYLPQQAWFHCAATKVGNVGAVGAATGGLPSWDTTRPTASVQSGAGCGSTNTPGFSGAGHAGLYDTVFAGTFTGNLRSMALELHSIYAGTGRADGNVGVAVEVAVDGVIYKVTATPAVVRVKAEPSATKLSEKVVFTLTGFPVFDDKNRDRIPDEGPGTTQRAITIKVRHGFIDANPLGAFVYDTTEVPSGVTFNPTADQGVVAEVAPA
jgi:hypothetical protein